MERPEQQSGDFMSVLTVFQTLKSKAARLLEPLAQEEGLTRLQAGVLFLLMDGDATVGDISADTCMGQANTSSLCKKLEKGGYLTRRRSPSDRRVVTLSITEQGRNSILRLQKRMELATTLLDGMPIQVRDDFVRGLKAANLMLDYLYENLKETDPC